MNGLKYFSVFELALLTGSVTAILLSFFLFGGENYLTLAASLIGAFSLVFSAKGNPIGPLLMVIFSVLYGIISFATAYYGEMITYLGMTLPMSVFSLIAWLKNPYKGKRSQVEINRLDKREIGWAVVLAVIVTLAFYFILKALDTANLIPGTISVTTSFLAAYLTARRSPLYALCYAANDIVLIVLWVLAAMKNTNFASVIICFVVFLINDIYGYVSWKKMYKLQRR